MRTEKRKRSAGGQGKKLGSSTEAEKEANEDALKESLRKTKGPARQ